MKSTRENPRRGVLLLPLLAVLFFSTANAQAGDDLPGFGNELSLFQDIPSVFGASKYEQKVTEAPSSISIVTASEIRKYGYRTLADILNSLRGFYITDDRTYSYAGVRGFGRPGDYNSRILILIDGHRYNDNIYHSGFIGNELGLDVDLIDRVEVIRGPSSSLYGTSAFFGVVNIITKRGRDYQGPEISAAAASHDTYDGRLTYGRRFGGGLELLLSGTAGDAEGEDWYYPEFDDPASNFGRAEGLDEEDFRQAYLKASAGDFTLAGFVSERTKEYPTAPWETAFNVSPSEATDERYYLDLSYARAFRNDLHLAGRVFYDHYQFEGLYPYDWADYEADPLAAPDIHIGRDEAEGEWWGAEVQLSARLADHQLVLGADYRDNLKQDQFYWDDRQDPDSLLLDSTASSDYWAVYLQDEFHLLESLIVNVGVRHDNYSTFGGTTNPRLALIYAPAEKTVLKFLYGEAFRAPNVYEMFYHDGYTTSIDNPDLEPETITTYEAVLEQYFGSHLRGVLTGFYYEIEDLISQVEDDTILNADGEPMLIYRNLDEVEAWGAEVELEGKLPSGLQAAVSYTFQHTEDKATGRTLSNSPKHLAKLHVAVPLWKERLFLGLEEQYTSSRKTVSGGEAGGFAVTNLTLFARQLYEGLELSASVYNLFDKEYGHPGSTEHLQDTIEQDGRIFRLKVSYLF